MGWVRGPNGPQEMGAGNPDRLHGDGDIKIEIKISVKTGTYYLNLSNAFFESQNSLVSL